MKPTNKLDAYFKTITEGTAINNKVRIIERLKTGAQTIDTLAIALNLKFHQISGRLSELSDEGVVKQIHNPTGRFSIYTLVSDPNEQEAIAAERLTEKKNAWLDQGYKKGFINSFGEIQV